MEESDSTLEQRVAALEQKVFGAGKVSTASGVDENGLVDGKPWWKATWGMFKDDPDYVEAMRLGREYREAQRLPDDE